MAAYSCNCRRKLLGHRLDTHRLDPKVGAMVVAGKMHGRGKYNYSDGAVYDGE